MSGQKKRSTGGKSYHEQSEFLRILAYLFGLLSINLAVSRAGMLVA